MNQRIQLSDHFTTSRILRFAASPIIMMVFTSIYSVGGWIFRFQLAGNRHSLPSISLCRFYRHLAASAFMLGTGGTLWLL